MLRCNARSLRCTRRRATRPRRRTCAESMLCGVSECLAWGRESPDGVSRFDLRLRVAVSASGRAAWGRAEDLSWGRASRAYWELRPRRLALRAPDGFPDHVRRPADQALRYLPGLEALFDARAVDRHLRCVEGALRSPQPASGSTPLAQTTELGEIIVRADADPLAALEPVTSKEGSRKLRACDEKLGYIRDEEALVAELVRRRGPGHDHARFGYRVQVQRLRSELARAHRRVAAALGPDDGHAAALSTRARAPRLPFRSTLPW